MLDVVLIKDNEGVERARGIIARNLVTGKIERFAAHAVVIGTGGYGNTYFLSTNAMASNGSAAMQVYRKGAYFANPCFAQIHPTCIPVHGDKQSKLTLMSESLRNDGRIWVPKKLEDAKALQAGTKKPTDIPDAAARLLHSMITRLRPQWTLTIIPGSVDEAVAWFKDNPQPDLIFLDIQLADGNAFDFLSAVHPSSIIIFTTAYDQYAIRAFTVNSIDYILKPIDETRLLDAIIKYETLQNKGSA